MSSEYSPDSQLSPLRHVQHVLQVYLRALLYVPVYWVRNILLKAAAWKWFVQDSQFRYALVQFYLRYIFVSPYTICREYFGRHSDETVQTIYGETPLATFQTIAELANIQAGESVYELGCGRGIGVFWLRLFKLAKCTGIDVNPVFIRKANEVRQATRLDNLTFAKANFLEYDMADADVIYLYGTALQDATISKLAKHFKHLRSGTRIVTVSYPLSEYASAVDFPIMGVSKARFLWGDTTLYLQVKA